MDIQGIEVLNCEPIKEPNIHYVIPCCAIALIIFGVLTFSLFAFDYAEELFSVLVVIEFVVVVLLISTYGKQETDRYRYEVTINDDVSFKDIYDNYEIVDQEGKIYTLIDKED